MTEHIESCELKDWKLEVKSELTDMYEVFDEMRVRFKPLIVEFLNMTHPDKKDMWDTYEGGVDTWWGIGSVSLYELGHVVTVKYSDEGMQITFE